LACMEKGGVSGGKKGVLYLKKEQVAYMVIL
jgi:hypothetical protein